MNHIVLRQFIEHGADGWQHLCCFLWIRCGAKSADRVTGRFVIVAIPQSFFAIGTNSL